MLEVCDDNNLNNGDTCNPTCNLTNTTSVFVGSPGQQGQLDGIGMQARLGGWCVITADNTYLWLGDSINAQRATLRRIDIASGTVLTVAGSSPGDIDNPIGLQARFNFMEAVTTDGSTIWVADGGNHKIKAVDTQPPYSVTTVAGSGNQMLQDGIGVNASFDGLRGLTYYAGYVYILDGSQHVLRRFDVQTQEVTTIAGQAGVAGSTDGPANQATFNSPRYMTSDNSGTLFISDTQGAKIRTYNVNTAMVGTFVGNGIQGYTDGVGQNAQIHRPRGLTSDGTSIYIAEFNQNTIRQGVIATQELTTNVGQDCAGGMNCPGGYQEGQGVANTQFSRPVGLAWHGPSGTMFACDTMNNVIRRVQ